MAMGCEGSQLWGVGVESEVRTGAWGRESLLQFSGVALG